jgi:hypothetical protein
MCVAVMHSYGFLWIHMDSYGLIRIHMEFPMDSCGFLSYKVCGKYAFLCIPKDSYMVSPGVIWILIEILRIPMDS